MAKKKVAPTTHIAVVLDKSGSMTDVADETISGFNQWLKEQQDAPPEQGTADLTLTMFDTRFTTPVVNVDVRHVNPLDGERYVPGGFTALYDAVADAVERMDKANPGDTGSKFLVCIITDGQENSSKRVSRQQLAELVSSYEARGNWTFTYLSAGINAFADAGAIGVGAGNTASYVGSARGTTTAFRNLAMNTQSLRSSANSRTSAFYSTTGVPAALGEDDPTAKSRWVKDDR